MFGRVSCVLDHMYKVKNDKRYIVLYILGYLIIPFKLKRRRIHEENSLVESVADVSTF